MASEIDLTKTSPIRVRIAPSPTGNLHVGTARTALFNYLFAQHHLKNDPHAAFVLRIEDTDLERSEAAYTQNIYDSLRALGLSWDEGPDVGGPYAPYTQSECLEAYKKVALQLVEQGLAYYSYATEAEIDALRQKAADEKRPFVYKEPQRSAEDLQRLEQEASGQASIRFRIPENRGTVIVSDVIRGDVAFDTNLLGDFVILKANGTPAYNFAVVVDDHQMAISHVIRGEDHLPNTPKQVLLYEALGWPLPAFAHVGMILAPDRSKLSKRHGATAVSDYIAQGYLPEAFVNFLALLGWSSPTGDEILSLDKLVEQFSLERIAHSGAVFDIEKLNWMNAHYLRQLPTEELLARLKPYLAGYNLQEYSQEQLLQLVDAVKEPLVVLSDVTSAVDYFFGQPVKVDAEIEQTVLNTPASQQVLATILQEWLPDVGFDTIDGLSAALKELTTLMKAKNEALKPKDVMWAVRAATTGRVKGADLPTTLYLLGKERVAFRVKQALQKVQASV